MAVWFNFIPAGSNKTINVPLQSIAYGDGPKWKVLVPKIDKLSFTYNIAPQDHRKVKQGLWDLVKHEAAFSSAPTTKTKRYKTRVALTHPETGSVVLIEADPKVKNSAFMRFEFNPFKLGASGVEFFKNRLLYDIFLGNYLWEQIATDCKVTRLDIAVDILNVPLDKLIVQSKKGGKSHSYYSAEGKLETAYLSIKNGKPATETAYNKGQQLLDAGRTPKFRDVPHTRIECRVTPNRPIVKLGKQKNPFEDVVVSYPALPAHLPESGHNWEHFLDSARHRGVDGALSLILDEDLRAAYSFQLKQAQQPLWCPAKLWAAWPKVLSKSGLLP